MNTEANGDKLPTAEETPRPLSLREAGLFFPFDRDTITRRVRLARLQPVGERDGYPVYAVGDLFRILLEAAGDDGDPATLAGITDPFRRRAAIQAERLMVDLEADRLEYISALDIELETFRKDALISAALDAVPVVLRRAGLNDDAIAVAQREIDTLRGALAETRL